MVNIRTKGATGERQVIKIMTDVLTRVLRELDYPEEILDKATTMIQRNQNQSAVGGNDLTNTLGISVEVKRQEQLAINTWWNQCVTAAERNGELPLLVFKQNNKAWRFITMGFLHVPAAQGWTSVQARVEFDQKDFERWWAAWIKGKIASGFELRF